MIHHLTLIVFRAHKINTRESLLTSLGRKLLNQKTPSLSVLSSWTVKVIITRLVWNLFNVLDNDWFKMGLGKHCTKVQSLKTISSFDHLSFLRGILAFWPPGLGSWWEQLPLSWMKGLDGWMDEYRSWLERLLCCLCTVQKDWFEMRAFGKMTKEKVHQWKRPRAYDKFLSLFVRTHHYW